MVGSNDLDLDRWDAVTLQRAGSVSEEAAFAASLLDATEPAFKVIRAFGVSPEDAADALQEASIRAWRHRGACRGDFRPWFITIALREARRPRRRWLTVPMYWRARNEDARTHEVSDALTASLQTLPQRQRVAISLRYEVDMSIAGIATAMAISEPAAKQLLARARDSLRRTLSETDTRVTS